MKAEKVKVVPQEKLEYLIEPNIFERLSKEEYDLYKADARSFLTYNRFSLSFKILFLHMLDKCYEFGEEVYLEHIRAFSYGSFVEPHSKDKIGKQKFINEFIKIYEDIENYGFNPKKSVLPLSTRNHIKNGSHRLAAAIFTNKDVYFIKTENKGPVFDYKYFIERNVRPEFMDAGATIFAQYSNNCYIALVWPSAKGFEDEIQEVLKRVVYRKEVNLNQNGAKNLLSQVYDGESWLGSVENDFAGVFPKLNGCFSNDGPLRAYLFKADSLEEVVAIKEKIRSFFKLDKHSIHITDTQEEVDVLSNLLFNNNAIHFLNHAKPNNFKSFNKKLRDFKQFIQNHEINADDIILDSGMVLSAYGLRESSDVDFLVNQEYSVPHEEGIFSNHIDFVQHYSKTPERLIYDPRNYFYFNGVKFLALHEVYEFKKNRGGKKDLTDLKLIEALLENDNSKMQWARLKQKINFVKNGLLYKTEKFAGNTLRKIGLYDLINKYYLKLKR